MVKKLSIAVLVIFGMISCSNDDNNYNSVTFEVCEGVEQLKDVIVQNVSVAGIDTNNQSGYILKATVVNKTNSEIQEGRVIITFFANNKPFTYSIAEDCNNIQSNSSCELFSFLPTIANENIDQSPVVACYYYDF